MPDTGLLLEIKAATDLVQESVHLIRLIGECQTTDPAELRQDTNASLTLCEVHNNLVRRSLVYRQHLLFQALAHPYCLPHPLSPQLELQISLRLQLPQVKPNLERGIWDSRPGMASSPNIHLKVKTKTSTRKPSLQSSARN
jgi:hypothetical protein